MKPTYEVKVWQEDNWWLARVVNASDSADPSPLNALTQARTLTKIEPMARDLVATILDAEEDAFDIEIDYVLPDDVGELLCQAKGARAWLDAAQELWQERSAIAARALTDKGYSLRETATLLGLSHQRVDQLLGGDVEHDRSNVWAFQVKSSASSRACWQRTRIAPTGDVDVLLVVRKVAEHSGSWSSNCEKIDPQLREQARELLAEWASRVSRYESEAQKFEESEGKVDALREPGPVRPGSRSADCVIKLRPTVGPKSAD